MHIHLGVSEETEFATVTEQIARLKRLAAANASEKCKFVIFVFSVPGDKPRPKPAEQPDVDGPDIDPDSIQIQFSRD